MLNKHVDHTQRNNRREVKLEIIVWKSSDIGG